MSVRVTRTRREHPFAVRRDDTDPPSWLYRWPGASDETELTGDWTQMVENAKTWKWTATKEIERKLGLRGVKAAIVDANTLDLE